MGKDLDMEVRLTGFDRPTRMESVTTSPIMETSGALTFAEEAGATVMTWDWQVLPQGWFRLLGPLGRTPRPAHGTHDLTGLKRRSNEAGPVTSA
jgi:hypothetical protein